MEQDPAKADDLPHLRQPFTESSQLSSLNSPLHESPPDQVRAAFPPPSFSRRATIVFAVLTFVLLAYQGFSHFGYPIISSLSDPVRTVPRVVDREMELREASRSLPAWKRLLHALWMGMEAHDPGSEAMSLYRQALEHWPPERAWSEWVRPTLLVHYSVLLAEHDRRSEAWKIWRELHSLAGYADFAETAQAVYAGQTSLPGHWRAAPYFLSGDGWLRDRFEARLARVGGDEAKARAHDTAIEQRGRSLQLRSLALHFLIWVVVLAGIAVVLGDFANGGSKHYGTVPGVMPLWSAWDGYGMFFRSLFLASLILMSVAWLPFGFPFDIIHHSYVLMMALPMFWLLSRHWSSPVSRWHKVMGLSGCVISPRHVGAATLAAFAVSILSSLCITLGFQWLDVPSDWLEGIVEPLLWGGFFEKTCVVLNMVAWAPLYEEILFRGLLFATLRKHCSLPMAASISSALWSFTHFYSLEGTLHVLLFGIILCVLYERTRSLIPCMLCHALLNVVNVGFTLLILA